MESALFARMSSLAGGDWRHAILQARAAGGVLQLWDPHNEVVIIADCSLACAVCYRVCTNLLSRKESARAYVLGKPGGYHPRRSDVEW